MSERRAVPHGGGIVLGLIAVLPFWLLVGMCACSWAPHVVKYPSGLTIARVDQHTLDRICGDEKDDGAPILPGEHAAGCYSQIGDTIYILNSCEGAEALTHELAHREGIADPEKAGFDW